MPVLLVALGGALGAVARYLVATVFVRRFGAGWPYGTLAINLSGCLFIAIFLSAMAEHVSMQQGWRYFFPIGFVGAYTTFSTYEFELGTLLNAGQVAGAALYFTLSNLLGFGAIVLGNWLGQKL